ncbi:MAG: hypothetical protein PWP07_1658 [Epulopiscium sp.]|nr:hypothetical protein [Candidatus Epulonipiscium sp.]
MAKTFGAAEHRILNMFKVGTHFIYNGIEHVVTISGKPTCSKGEPKTDIYIEAKSATQATIVFKISFKKQNADFLENKTNAERAEQLLGNDWNNIISMATSNIRDAFYSRPLIYKNKFGRTDAGAITLGWKFELLNVLSGQLSGAMQLSREQVIDVYAGTNLTGDKKDATVNGITIPNSGVSNYILFEDQAFNNIQQVIDSLITIEEYVTLKPNVYFACKALNYRTFSRKYDGNRPLAVYVDWYIKNGKLAYNICFDTPLMQGGNYAFDKLKIALDTLGAETTSDLASHNVEDTDKIYE